MTDRPADHLDRSLGSSFSRRRLLETAGQGSAIIVVRNGLCLLRTPKTTRPSTPTNARPQPRSVEPLPTT